MDSNEKLEVIRGLLEKIIDLCPYVEEIPEHMADRFGIEKKGDQKWQSVRTLAQRAVDVVNRC